MAGKFNIAIYIFAAFMVVIICGTGERALSDTINLNVFERFRNEMAIDHDVAAVKFMSPFALTKWNATIMPSFKKGDRQLGHFFAFSMLVPKIKDSDLFVIYFNPWVDGALFTQWKKVNQTWKLENFYLASGERVRGLITPQSITRQNNIPPIWLWQKGPFIINIISYYKDMRARLVRKDINEYLSWFSLSDAEIASDLLRVGLRMGARIVTAADYLARSKSGPILTGAFSKLKYDTLTGNKKKLASYSRNAGVLVDLNPDIIKTMRVNWIFNKEGAFTAVLSSPVAPRLFVIMNIANSGKIQGALLGDLEFMAAKLQASASSVRTAKPVQPVAPIQPIRKVQRYRAVTGEMVEIITEKHGGRTTRTTRVNGKVMEALTY